MKMENNKFVTGYTLLVVCLLVVDPTSGVINNERLECKL